MGHHSHIFISITDPPRPAELEIDDIETLEQVDQLLKDGDIKNAELLVYYYLKINTDDVVKYLQWKYLLYDTIRQLTDAIECKVMVLVNSKDPSQTVHAYVWGKHTLRWDGDYAKRVDDNIWNLELLNEKSSFDYNYQHFFSEELAWNTGYDLGPVEIGSLNPRDLV